MLATSRRHKLTTGPLCENLAAITLVCKSWGLGTLEMTDMAFVQ